MQSYILVVNGKPESGKDTFAATIIRYFFHNKNILVNNISTVDYIKVIAKMYFGWDGEKDDCGRRLLSDLKDASTRYNRGPFLKVIKTIDNHITLYNENIHIWIVHSREPEDIQRFKEHYKEKCKTVLLRRDINQDIISSNHADKNVEDYIYDYYLENNGTKEEFENTCVNFINNLGIQS